MSDGKAPSALLEEISKKGAEPHKAPVDKESPALVQAKTLTAIAKGSASLKHVEAPAGGLTEAQKAAYLEDKKEKEAGAGSA